jgi:alpha-tubulin suppressor-like RCC1 family protein
MNIKPSFSSQAKHSFFVTPEGDLFIWGNNKNYSLGIADNTSYKYLP